MRKALSLSRLLLKGVCTIPKAMKIQLVEMQPTSVHTGRSLPPSRPRDPSFRSVKPPTIYCSWGLRRVCEAWLPGCVEESPRLKSYGMERLRMVSMRLWPKGGRNRLFPRSAKGGGRSCGEEEGHKEGSVHLCVEEHSKREGCCVIGRHVPGGRSSWARRGLLCQPPGAPQKPRTLAQEMF
jgi:hypothetical protein